MYVCSVHTHAYNSYILNMFLCDFLTLTYKATESIKWLLPKYTGKHTAGLNTKIHDCHYIISTK